jgi:indolepyruvate ferredoxin oxidoreductase
MQQDVSLADKYDLKKHQVLLNGTQALVRMMLMQSARDRAAGHSTAGYVTGYRGSPLGAVDFQMTRASEELEKAQVRFQEGLNEDLAATALWGSQQSELRGEGKFEGVFGLWYGKGPGVDRSGDVFRHANMAGTSPLGGVVAALGDDHTGESSTTLHQSELTMIDSFMPVLSPAGVQEVMDYGLFGFALSRFAGVWAGLKCIKDTIEVTSVVNGDPLRLQFVTPEFDMPEGGLNIRLLDTPQAQEARIIHHKRRAVQSFARANRMDKRVLGQAGAKIGFVAAGKNWLDLAHAMQVLGIDQKAAVRHGVTTYKVAMTWPLDMQSFSEWAEGLDCIVVVEEKRKLIESQIKEVLFNQKGSRRVFGAQDGQGALLFADSYALDPIVIAQKLGQILIAEGCGSAQLTGALERIDAAHTANNAPTLASRVPYFCSGCPHSSSTKIPEGSRAYSGIGCHYMVQWMDRETLGFTQMGGEGANWIGESLFSTRSHVFQNIGDGTYNHSGIQAIRAAVAAGTTMTYKILFNDAVAMTGGQNNDGGLDAARIVQEMLGIGVKHLAVVYDEKEDISPADFPAGIQMHPRAQLNAVQEGFRQLSGVSVIVYVQTCAAEKRRRRKRGAFPNPDQRLFINPDVCEGCGDCGVQSNCVSLLPLETPLGRKRQIDQSSCNKDFSCVNGFCPSFATVRGGQLRRPVAQTLSIPEVPAPEPCTLKGTHNIVVTGVGGTGVVTIGALLAMAAHLDGKAAGVMEMAGLAQKGGAVHIHCRIGETPEDISAIRVALGECDALIGGDLVVSAQGSTLGLMAPTGGAVVNRHEIITGDFTRDTAFAIPGADLHLALTARLQERARLFNATRLAETALGDTVYANMILLGAAYQQGLLPLTQEALLEAIALNGAKVPQNQQAFALGRWAMVDPDLDRKFTRAEAPVQDPEASRLAGLRAYGSGRLARYEEMRGKLQSMAPELQELALQSYHKLLSYKDEYEVARLLLTTKTQVAERFEGDYEISYHLAPPLLAQTGPDGRPQKRSFGAWFDWVSQGLARLSFLRETPFDPFGYSAERRMERQLIKDFESLVGRMLRDYDPERLDIWQEILSLPLNIRGFGPVKLANAKAMQKRRVELLDQLTKGHASERSAA